MTPKSKAPPNETRKVRRKDPRSFDPRYKDALLAGLHTPVVFSFENHRQATKFRQRLQAYRFAVKEENTDPGLVTILYRVVTKIEGSRVIIAPVDSEFDSALSQVASLDHVPPMPHTPPSPGLPDEGTQAPTIEDLFADLESSQSNPFEENI